jgi:hypothetical protein
MWHIELFLGLQVVACSFLFIELLKVLAHITFSYIALVLYKIYSKQTNHTNLENSTKVKHSYCLTQN